MVYVMRAVAMTTPRRSEPGPAPAPGNGIKEPIEWLDQRRPPPRVFHADPTRLPWHAVRMMGRADERTVTFTRSLAVRQRSSTTHGEERPSKINCSRLSRWQSGSERRLDSSDGSSPSGTCRRWRLRSVRKRPIS